MIVTLDKSQDFFKSWDVYLCGFGIIGYWLT